MEGGRRGVKHTWGEGGREKRERERKVLNTEMGDVRGSREEGERRSDIQTYHQEERGDDTEFTPNGTSSC